MVDGWRIFSKCAVLAFATGICESRDERSGCPRWRYANFDMGMMFKILKAATAQNERHISRNSEAPFAYPGWV
jgi:hypothetical protein